MCFWKALLWLLVLRLLFSKEWYISRVYKWQSSFNSRKCELRVLLLDVASFILILNEKGLRHTVVVTGCVVCLCLRFNGAISISVPKHVLVTLGRKSGCQSARAGGLVVSCAKQHLHDRLVEKVIGHLMNC